MQNNVQIRQKAEELEALANDYNPLENTACKIGDNACAAKHLAVIQRTGLFHPMNESQRVQSLLRLQQQYGNRFVQRVIAQHIQTKLTVSQPGDITKVAKGREKCSRKFNHESEEFTRKSFAYFVYFAYFVMKFDNISRTLLIDIGGVRCNSV